MRRRAILSGLGIGLFGLSGVRRATAAPPPSVEIATYLTHSGLNDLSGPFHLRRAAGTGYDPSGIEVVDQAGEVIGRLPPIHSAIIAPLVDARRIAHVRVMPSQARPEIRISLV